jgi:hypothetical protein
LLSLRRCREGLFIVELHLELHRASGARSPRPPPRLNPFLELFNDWSLIWFKVGLGRGVDWSKPLWNEPVDLSTCMLTPYMFRGAELWSLKNPTHGNWVFLSWIWFWINVFFFLFF